MKDMTHGAAVTTGVLGAGDGALGCEICAKKTFSTLNVEFIEKLVIQDLIQIKISQQIKKHTTNQQTLQIKNR